MNTSVFPLGYKVVAVTDIGDGKWLVNRIELTRAQMSAATNVLIALDINHPLAQQYKVLTPPEFVNVDSAESYHVVVDYHHLLTVVTPEYIHDLYTNRVEDNDNSEDNDSEDNDSEDSDNDSEDSDEGCDPPGAC